MSTRPVLLALSAMAVGIVAVVACVGEDTIASGGSSGDRSSDASSSSDTSSSGDNSSDANSSGASGNVTLTVNLEGDAGAGKVSSAPPGIDCGSTCAAAFAPNASVTLTALPDTNNGFAGWTKDGAGCSSALTCAVTMTGPKSVGAMFAAAKSAAWVQAVSSTGNDADTHAAIDKDGNIFFVTNFGGSFSFGGKTYSTGNIFLAKLSPTGAVIWAKTFGGGGSDSVSGIAVGKTGDVAIGGVAGSASLDFGSGKTITTDGEDPFIVKLSGIDGAAQWAKVITTDPADGPGLEGIAMDGLGNVIVSGHFNTSVNFNDGTGQTNVTDQVAFLAKYTSADGSTINPGWKRLLTGAAYAFGNRIVVDSTNDFVVAGYFSGTIDLDPGTTANPTMTATGVNDGFVAKFQNVNGTWLWQKQIGAGGDDSVVSASLVDTTSNDVVVIARYQVTNGVAPSFAGTAMSTPSASSYDVAIGRLASGNGAVQWAKRYGGSGSEFAYDITVLGADRYAITGYSNADVSFDAQPTISFAGSGGDGWFAVLEGAGAPSATWAFKAGSAGLDTGQVVLGRNKMLYGFGKFIGDGAFLGKTVVNAGSYDAYLFGAVVP